MNENRPNIVTIGVLAAALAQLACFAWNRVLPELALGAQEGAALATVFTFAAQYLDRFTKRQVGYVVTKYADQTPGQPPS